MPNFKMKILGVQNLQFLMYLAFFIDFAYGP